MELSAIHLRWTNHLVGEAVAHQKAKLARGLPAGTLRWIERQAVRRTAVDLSIAGFAEAHYADHSAGRRVVPIDGNSADDCVWRVASVRFGAVAVQPDQAHRQNNDQEETGHRWLLPAP